VKYFHRTTVSPDAALVRATTMFGARLAPVSEGGRTRSWSGGLGSVSVSAAPEGGHYTLVTVVTDQPGESELDRLAKRYLGEVHVLAEPGHVLRGAY
jgi:hypothetical protein